MRWLRAAELTCDRAALLVAQDERVGGARAPGGLAWARGKVWCLAGGAGMGEGEGQERGFGVWPGARARGNYNRVGLVGA